MIYVHPAYMAKYGPWEVSQWAKSMGMTLVQSANREWCYLDNAASRHL